MSVIRLSNVTRRMASGTATLTVLDGVCLEVPAGQCVALVGPSGSGKSTLLSIIAGIDRPSEGTVEVAGRDYSRLTDDELAVFRGRSIGVVFQAFHLLPGLTAQENVQVPMELAGLGGAPGRARELLDRVGLSARAHHYPIQLSGGEQQRVALARAFSAQPEILLADEPTGHLDSASGARVLELLDELRRDHHATVVVVTHDRQLASRADRIVALRDGRLDGEPAPAPEAPGVPGR